MKKILLLTMLFCLSSISTFAYTYSLEDENGNIIFDKKCTANGDKFDCFDRISKKGSTEPRYQRSVDYVYINGKKEKVIKEQMGDIVYIKY